MAQRVVATTCRECNVRCGSLVYVEGERVVRITGNPAHPGSQGAFCIKGMHSPEVSRLHPDRPLYPLKRIGARGSGAWQRVSWDTALAEIADALGRVKSAYGPLAIAGAVSGPMVSRGIAMTQILRCLGSPNYMINQDLCQGCRATAALLTGISGQPGNEMHKTRCILVIGKSPSDSSVVQWMHIKAAKARGAKLIVVDPRRTQIARMADLWLPIRPGTDAALALSMINVILAEDLIDHDFVTSWCTGVDELRERVAKYPPAVAAGITGIPGDRIVKAARLFATVKPGCMTMGHGIDAQANGVGTAIAFLSLLALTGNIDKEGANRLSKPLPGFRDLLGVMSDPKFRLPSEIEQKIIGGKDFPFWSGPNSWAKTCHNPSVMRAINTGEPYPVKAMYVSGVNILCTYPGIDDTAKALKSLDLLVVATDHITPTALLADYVLPKTVSLEEDDLAINQGGSCLSVIQRVFPPRGETKTDIEIAIALRDKLRERGLIEFELLPWNSHREFLEFQLERTGLKFDELLAKGFHEYPFEYGDYRKKGFKTPSGKIELSSERLRKAGYDALPDYREPSYAAPTGGFDLILLTGIRSMAFHHSRFRNHDWARKIQSTPELRIHPATAGKRGIQHDDWVWVEMPAGLRRVLLRAMITEDVPENVVATGMGWWYPELDGWDRGALTFNVDAGIPYGPPWDPISGSAEARNIACRITRAEPSEVSSYSIDTTKEIRATARA